MTCFEMRSIIPAVIAARLRESDWAALHRLAEPALAIEREDGPAGFVVLRATYRTRDDATAASRRVQDGVLDLSRQIVIGPHDETQQP